MRSVRKLWRKVTKSKTGIFIISFCAVFFVFALLQGSKIAYAESHEVTIGIGSFIALMGVYWSFGGFISGVLNMFLGYGGFGGQFAGTLGPWGLIIIAIGVIIIYLGLLGDDKPEQVDMQADAMDVLEDRASLASFLEDERTSATIRSLCDRDIPPVSGSFLKRPLRTTNEYTYSYTLSSCDKAKSFFVRLNGTSGMYRTEFRSLSQGRVFSNSKVIEHFANFHSVCIKIIGQTKQICFSKDY